MADVASKPKSALKGKGGLVALGVTIALIGWYVVDVTKGPPPRDPDAKPPVSDFVHVMSRDVSRVEVKRPSGGFTLDQDRGQWQVEAPGRYRADNSAVNDWLKGLLEDNTVTETGGGRLEALSQYGLDKPSIEVIFSTKGGDTRTLQIGKEFKPSGGSGGSAYFARDAKEPGRLFLISNTQVDLLRNKRIDDLRDKHLFDIADDKKLTKLVFQRPNEITEVDRRGDNWQITQPFQAAADKFTTDTLATDIKSSLADSFTDTPSTDLAKYGLDKPTLVIQAFDDKGPHTLRVGRNADAAGKVYAQREGEPDVMTVSKIVFDGVDKKAGDLRDRKLITLDADKVRLVELHNQYGTVTLQKTSGNQWQMAASPAAKPVNAKADMVQRVIDTARTGAYKFIEESPKDLTKYGLDKPQITVRVNDGHGTNQVLEIGSKAPGKETLYYAKGVPDAIFTVQSFAYGDLNVKPDAFKDTGKK